MALSKPMRAALEAVARGGAHQDRVPLRRYTVTIDETGWERHGLYTETTLNALRKRKLIEYDDKRSGVLRMPWAITEAGRVELAKGAK